MFAGEEFIPLVIGSILWFGFGKLCIKVLPQESAQSISKHFSAFSKQVCGNPRPPKQTEQLAMRHPTAALASPDASQIVPNFGRFRLRASHPDTNNVQDRAARVCNKAVKIGIALENSDVVS